MFTTIVRHTLRRRYTTRVPNVTKRPPWLLMCASAVAVTELGGFVLSRGDMDDDEPGDRAALAKMSIGKLLSGWMHIPFVVDASPSILETLARIPVISSISNAIIRQTFFSQFCAGETTEECVPAIQALRASNVGAILCYEVEASYDGKASNELVTAAQLNETMRAIETAGKFEATDTETRTWLAIKLSGLLSDPKTLERRSAACGEGPIPRDGYWENLWKGTSEQDTKDITELKYLYDSLRTLMKRAQELGVRVYIDAEQTWYQLAIDVIQEQLMAEFNKGQHITVSGTFQAVLRRNDDLLRTQLDRARHGNYTLAFKLVRGAYVDVEEKRHGAKSGPPPVWTAKSDTDAHYDGAIRSVCTAIKKHLDNPTREPDVSAMFATHNEESVLVAFQALKDSGLAVVREDGKLFISEAVRERICFAQLYGMKDALTNRIAETLVSDKDVPPVVKYMPYGTLEEVMPYLSRRGTENKSLLSGEHGAGSERRRLGREIRRRIFTGNK